ncbi:MAG: hypothetical protein J2P15_10170 [Micromonosporaceae bacterium]|nr:hypothetical protein [Micromonosporaceae bacterium]
MRDESIRDATILARRGMAMSDLIAEAQSAAGSAEGVDESGAVRARVGQDAFPDYLWVDPDWQSRLPAGSFGAAVVQACRAANHNRDERLRHAMADDDWRYRLDEAARDDSPGRPHSQTDPAQLRRDARLANPRPFDEVFEDLYATLGTLDGLIDSPQQQPSGTGTDPTGALVVTVTEAGLQACTARADWVAGQRGTTLVEAFGRALTEARADLAQRRSAAGAAGLDQVGAHFQHLFEESLHNLHLAPRLDEE